MPAEGEPIESCGGAPGNEPAYPRPGAPAHETDPSDSAERQFSSQRTWVLNKRDYKHDFFAPVPWNGDGRPHLCPALGNQQLIYALSPLLFSAALLHRRSHDAQRFDNQLPAGLPKQRLVAMLNQCPMKSKDRLQRIQVEKVNTG
jgi:hypothetical protein